MSLTHYAYCALVLILANMPFVSKRFFWCIPMRRKIFLYYLLEWVLMYVLALLIGRSLEAQYAPRHHLQWQFFVSSVVLFLLAAYPGFIYRYLWRRA